MTDLTRPSVAVKAPQMQTVRFYRPPLPVSYVPRPQLCTRLSEGLTGRLLLISAPAGFGKSSLAIELCESLPCQWQSLWIALNPRDQDCGRFLERLVIALQQVYPHLGQESLVQLQMRQRHQPFAFDEWLETLLDEWQARVDIERPLLVVLDDYHLAQNSVLDRCVQFLLSHMPPGLCLLVTSRKRPDWHLARLRLSRQLLELSEQDLRLTEAEALQLLSLQGCALSDQELSLLLRRSEGWVAGLRLWSLAQQGQDSPLLYGPVSRGEELIHDYLLEEVIERQPPEVQAFLYATASQERFCAQLCDALLDTQDSSEILRHLQAHQVFLVPLDEQGKWFRYHHLFSDLLRSRLQSSVQSHLRACRWFSEAGLLDEAIEQALRAGQSEVAANLVQNLSEEQLLAEQNVATLLRWKMDIPDSLLISTARLILLYGWALALACQLDEAQSLLRHLERFLPAADPDEHRSLIAQWLALSGVIARSRGDAKTAYEHCTEALSCLPVERYGQRLLCLSSLTNLALAKGHVWRARSFSRDALELAQRIANPLFEAFAHYDRARVLQARGEVSRALEQVRQGQQCLREEPADKHYAVRGRLTLYEGYLHSLRLHAAPARECLLKGIAEARSCRDVSVVLGLCVLANLDGQSGELSSAFAHLSEAERLMHSWDVPAVYYLGMVTLVKCELWLLQGQTELASVWLGRLREAYNGDKAAVAPEFHPHLAMHIQLCQAKYERQIGAREQSRQRLFDLLKSAEEAGAQLVVSMVQMQLAYVLHELGDKKQSQALVHGVVQQAETGALLPFSEALRLDPRWLRSQLMLEQGSDLLSELQALLPEHNVLHEAPEQPKPVTGFDALSARELSVLRMIAQGCSNQQISDGLFISLHTVKTHARHINSKLGVERRTQAVARAKELGLLED